ncbi:ferritin-3 chloroplastic [Prunus yedoensis var. nudiflora]|uniref:Ferritin-3 chloroplastic n=1 Tax=Prunus yedoensis var. nudiflora TaxID=2094558 RepID=A0A314Y1K5_PRUYE|nr:ferritin-3 chloroplastic [Prunus yedoensis var. nudiflora]
MLLKGSPASSHLIIRGDNLGPLFPSAPSSSSSKLSHSFFPLNSFTSLNSILRFPPTRNEGGVVVCASKNANNRPLTGVIFEPFEEVKKELELVPTLPQVSLARQKFTDESEAAINEQINVEYNVSYVYHAMFAYFDGTMSRSRVLPSFSRNPVRKRGNMLRSLWNTRINAVEE